MCVRGYLSTSACASTYPRAAHSADVTLMHPIMHGSQLSLSLSPLSLWLQANAAAAKRPKPRSQARVVRRVLQDYQSAIVLGIVLALIVLLVAYAYLIQ